MPMDTRTALADLFNGIKSAGQALAISDAQVAVDAIKAQKLGANEERRSLAQIAQKLTMNLSGQGASAAEVEQMRLGMMAGVPPQPQSLQQLFMQEAAAGGIDSPGAKEAQKMLKFVNQLDVAKVRAARAKTPMEIVAAQGKELTKAWEPINKSVDLASAGRSSFLRPIGQALLKGNEIVAELQNANITAGSKQSVAAALASIVTGGQPTEGMIKEFNDRMSQDDVNKLFTYIQSKPVGAKYEEYKQYVTGLLKRMESAALQTGLGAIKAATFTRGDLIKRFGDDYKSLVAKKVGQYPDDLELDKSGKYRIKKGIPIRFNPFSLDESEEALSPFGQKTSDPVVPGSLIEYK